jgi:hypothetical protein
MRATNRALKELVGKQARIQKGDERRERLLLGGDGDSVQGEPRRNMSSLKRLAFRSRLTRAFQLFCCLAAFISVNAAKGPEAASPKVEIAVTYDVVGVSAEGSPWRTNRKWTILLAGGRAVRTTYAAPGRDTEQHEGVLGRTGGRTNELGLKGIGSLRVVAGAIVSTSDYPTWTWTWTIKTDGKSLCSATADVRLKPGNRLFENGGGHFDSDMHAENVSCSIRTVED